MNIIHLVSNKVWGGGEQYVLDLARESVADGCNVTIVSRNIPAVAGRYKESGLPLVIMPLKGALDIVSPFRLAKLLDSMGPVVLHVHNFKDATVAVRARRLSGNKSVRIVVTRHLVKAAKRMSLYEKLDAIVFVSHLAKNEFLSTAPRIAPEKLHVVHNSIQYSAGATEQSKRSELRLMFHGRLSLEKGVDTLIKAFSMAGGNAKLVIAGDGDKEYVDSLRRLACELCVARRIEWIGHKNNIHPFIDKADVGICPSRVREAGALSVIEYMLHGKPVIASNNGSQPEYITNGTNGLLVPPDDAGAIAGAIAEISDTTRREAMGKAAKHTFDSQLAYPIFYSRIKAIYENETADSHS